jgi:hypothetical protein
MPVDARIALGVEPVKMPDFAQLAVQRSAVMNNMAEMASKQRALNEQNMLAQLMQDPNFSFDSAESRKLVHTRAPNIGGTVLKNYDDAQAAQAEAKTKALSYADAQTKSMLTELFQYRDFGPAETAIDERVASGLLTPEQGAAAKAKMRSYDKYDLFAADMARSQLTPAQMLEVERDQMDTGTELVDRAISKYAPTETAYTVTGRTTKTMSPQEQAANAVANRNAAVAERNAAVNEGTLALAQGKAAAADEEPFSALGDYNAKVESARNVLDVVDDLIGGADSPPVFDKDGKLVRGGGRIKAGEAGLSGATFAGLAETESFTVAAALETIKANLGFDRLQQMRADPDNKTGGALGQVAVQELARLESTVASVKQGQKIQKLYENLEKIRTHYNKYLKAHEEIDALKKFNRVNTGARFERVPVVDSKDEYDALPMRAPYRDSSGSLQFKGGPY